MTPRAPTKEEALSLLGAIERYVIVDCNKPTIRISHALNTLRAFIQGASGEDSGFRDPSQGGFAREGQAESSTVAPVQQEGRDWKEDFAHENGNYQCVCIDCKHFFMGHKRRMVCKLCSTPSPPQRPVDVEQAIQRLIRCADLIGEGQFHKDLRTVIVELTRPALEESHRELVEAARKAMDECADLIATDAGNALTEAITRAEAITERGKDG